MGDVIAVFTTLGRGKRLLAPPTDLGVRQMTDHDLAAVGADQILYHVEQVAVEARAKIVQQMEMEKKYAAERIDISMPGKKYKSGALHPITLVKNQLIDI